MKISASRMRNIFIALFLLSVVTLLCPYKSDAAQEVASFTSVKGEVRIKSDARASDKWLRVKKTGVTLFSGDEIRTLAGTAEITFDDGSVMKVAEDTSFKLEELPTNRKLFGFVDTSFMNRNIKVGFGKLWANIKKARGRWTSFESKVAVAGIKGTSVSMYVDSAGDMQFACHEGVAALAKPDGSYELSLQKGKEVWIKAREQEKTLIQSVKGELDIESKNGSIDLEDKGSVLIGESSEGTHVEVPGSDEKIVKVVAEPLSADLDAGDEIIIGRGVPAGESSVINVRNISGYLEAVVGDIRAMMGVGDAFALTVNPADGTVTLTVVNGSMEVLRDGETTLMREGDSTISEFRFDAGSEPVDEPDLVVDPIIEPLPVDCGSSQYMPGNC